MRDIQIFLLIVLSVLLLQPTVNGQEHKTIQRKFLRQISKPSRFIEKSTPIGSNILYYEDKILGESHTIYDTSDPTTIVEPEQVKKFAMATVNKMKSNKLRVEKKSKFLECQPGTPQYFGMIGKISEILKKPDEVINYTQGFCWKNTKMSFKWDSANQVTFSIGVSIFDRKHILCSDHYMIKFGTQLQMLVLEFPGTHKYTFKNVTAQDKQLMTAEGLQAFIFCDNMVDVIPDILKTLGLFVGGLGIVKKADVPFIGLKPWKMQEEWNIEFVKEATGFQIQKRNPVVNILPKEKIRSGDYFAVTRFDGLDQIIHIGTGSHSGHSVEAVWDRRNGQSELYIVESQDSWYWPHGKGLQRHKYDDWMQYAQDCGFNVAHLPLKKEIADKFNEAKVWEWFDTVKGMPYGYRNFLFSWVDTVKENYPSFLDINFVWAMFSVLSNINPKIGNLLVQEAMNMRLGTKDLTLWEIPVEAAKQGKKVEDLFAEVEKEGWMYSDGYQYVCSCFVTALWKRGGVFGDMEINSTEFTPKDIYQLNIFKDDGPIDPKCNVNDKGLPYCQFFGTYR